MSRRTHLILLRKAKGSQEVVACKLGISRQYLGLMEVGKRNPTVKLMARMERYFSVPAKQLFPDLFKESEVQEDEQLD